MDYFDTQAVIRNRVRSSLRGGPSFLLDYVLELILERLNGHFSSVMDFGCHNGRCADLIGDYITFDRLIQCDFALDILRPLKGDRVVVDPENLCFKKSSFDLIISALTLHSINNLGRTIKQIFDLLKPGGVFIANFFGPSTLKELRQAIMDAESIESVKHRVYPFIGVKDSGRMLQGCGFRFVVSDSELVEVSYDRVEDLFVNLKCMGESNALVSRYATLTTKSILDRIIAHYLGKVASYEVIIVTGMKPK